MVFHPKYQVCKSKLQSCPETAKVGYVMYCANNTQKVYLISNILEVVEKENGHKIEIVVHLELVFQTDPERKIFYRNYNKNYE